MYKVYTFVFVANEDAITLMKNARLMKVAILLQNAVNDAENYVDVLRMSVLADKYEKGKANE